jgi:ATP-binding cassette subfamily F protein 3
MLQVHQISKSYGAQTILDTITFSVDPNGRVGLVGANGCGKTTLLRIITGEEEADTGTVTTDADESIGYLPQGIEPLSGQSIAEYILAGSPALAQAQRALEWHARRMETDTSLPALTNFGEAQHQFEMLGGYRFESRAKSILFHLGLEDASLSDPMDNLSSGQRARVGLAQLLCAEPAILVLDEPTNHLDIQALEWLEGFLASYRGAVLIVSHDRRFLDETVDRILELDLETHHIKEYPGDYSDYQKNKAHALEKQWEQWKDQQTEVERIQMDIYATKERSLHTERKTNHDHYRRKAKKVAKRAEAKEKRLQRFLERDERVERPQAASSIQLQFSSMARSGQSVMQLRQVRKCFGEKIVIEGADLELLYGDRVALVGPNGAGKTTLMRMIMGEELPSSGVVKLGVGVRIGYMPQQQEVLDMDKSALDTIHEMAAMPENGVFNFLHYFLLSVDKARQPIGQLSFGERARLMLARLVVSGANFLILDEPINHLDIPSRLQFETALGGFRGTILVSVHDRYFIDDFASTIWKIENQRIKQEVVKLQW